MLTRRNRPRYSAVFRVSGSPASGPSLRPEGIHGAHRLKGRHALLEKTGETSNGAAGDGRVGKSPFFPLIWYYFSPYTI